VAARLAAVPGPTESTSTVAISIAASPSVEDLLAAATYKEGGASAIKLQSI
jgi:hypothetical protein